jgi:Uma2 family endonuclease
MQATKDERTYEPRPITVAEYHRLGETAFFGPEERVELLDGELIAMPRPIPEHVASTTTLTAFFHRTIGDRAMITAEGLIALDPISLPQPDVMLTRASRRDIWTSHPTPDDALLVVEVSKSSLSFDRGKKLRAYARCGVREYWIINLVNERIEVYRNRRRERYGKHLIVKRGETIAPEAFPDAVLAVEAILPPEGRM